MVCHGVMFAVVLELLGRHGRAEEILQVLEDILLGRRERARLRVRVEVRHGCESEDALLTW
jgi:predicted RNA-binding protein Jag